MKTITTTTNVFTFEELSEEAKEKARDWYRSVDDFDFSAECIIDGAKAIGALMGITIDKVLYSGFSSQGDGACFEGNYAYKKGSVKAVKEYAPQDEELHKIAEGLQELQRKAFYRLNATIEHSGRYYHENCTSIEVRDSAHQYDDIVSAWNEGIIKDFLRSFMQWIYSQLEKEYWYQNSDEVIDENIIANEYEFTKDGGRF